MVHFDLKSPNLLVTLRDKVPCATIADMGLVKARTATYVTGKEVGASMGGFAIISQRTLSTQCKAPAMLGAKSLRCTAES